MSSSYKLVGQRPQPLSISLDNLQVLTAFFNMLFSLLAGGVMVYGYSLFYTRLSTRKVDKQYAMKLGPLPLYIQENAAPGTLDRLKRPAKILEIYEFEVCPFCKKVRDALDHLDLDAMIYPCPKEGKKWRPQLIQRGGKAQFPYLVDPNTGKEMYESDEIIKYLFNTYGPGERYIPFALKQGKNTIKAAWLVNYFRSEFGRYSRVGTIPTQSVTVYVYEGSPFCKPVREALCELEIPYKKISVTRGSPKRQGIFDKYGHFQAPLLEDPNTGVAMFESKGIVDYLNRTYSKKAN